MIKKTIFCGCLAFGAIMAACSGKTDTPNIVAPTTFADSISSYYGILRGIQEANMIDAMPDSIKKDVDVEQLLEGVRTVLFADTAASFQQGILIGNECLQLISEGKAAGIDINAEQLFANFAKALREGKADSTKMEELRPVIEGLMTRYGATLQAHQTEQQVKLQSQLNDIFAEKVKEAKSLLDSVKSADPSIVTTESGLSYKVIERGNGATLTEGATGTAILTYRLPDGTILASSEGQFAPVPAQAMMPGLMEAFTTLPGGTKATLYIPYQLAFGEQGDSRIGVMPGQMIVVDIEIAD